MATRTVIEFTNGIQYHILARNSLSPHASIYTYKQTSTEHTRGWSTPSRKRAESGMDWVGRTAKTGCGPVSSGLRDYTPSEAYTRPTLHQSENARRINVSGDRGSLTVLVLCTKQNTWSRAHTVHNHSQFNSVLRTAITSAIILRRDGTLSQHPLIISHTRSESSGWSGQGGRRPSNIE